MPCDLAAQVVLAVMAVLRGLAACAIWPGALVPTEGMAPRQWSQSQWESRYRGSAWLQYRGPSWALPWSGKVKRLGPEPPPRS
ncbi:hypothetical protein ACLESD_25390 [Pyxidicoccus sp. 3LFB2]